jgi:hypothetical protein
MPAGQSTLYWQRVKSSNQTLADLGGFSRVAYTFSIGGGAQSPEVLPGATMPFAIVAQWCEKCGLDGDTHQRGARRGAVARD